MLFHTQQTARLLFFLLKGLLLYRKLKVCVYILGECIYRVFCLQASSTAEGIEDAIVYNSQCERRHTFSLKLVLTGRAF
jgi:hypothetical protein